MSRSNKHVYAGIGFIFASIAVAVILYIGIQLGSDSAPDSPPLTALNNAENVSASTDENDMAPAGDDMTASQDVQSESKSVTSADLLGVYADNVMGDNALCEGAGWALKDDGRFLSWDAARNVIMRGSWRVEGERLIMTATILVNPDGTKSMDMDDAEMPVSKQGDALVIGDMRYQPCNIQ